MTLVRFKPGTTKDFFRDNVVPSNMMSLIDSVFNDSVARFERSMFFTPRVDVTENAGQFEIQVALPGLAKEQVAVEIEKDTLKISGERAAREAAEGEKFHKIENYYGKFSRTFNIPDNVDKERIDASFENGMLNITLPKTEVKDVKSTVKIR